MVKAVQSMGTVFTSGKTYTVGLISFSIKIVRSDLPPKNGPEYMLGFGPKTEDVFYGPFHPPQMPEMLRERDADTA